MAAVERAIDQLEAYPGPDSFAGVASAIVDADERQIGRLATVLGVTGGQVVSPITRDIVDIASTGGPGSLSTILAPLFARALGRRVSKIAVPGRPAGGVDVLGSLPGYQAEMSATTARDVLEKTGYLHVLAGNEFCPLDAQFFQWRQQNGAQAIPALVIASLLAKKVAAGVGRLVLDIRVGPHGNFGENPSTARDNSRRLIAVAAELEISAVCILSTQPVSQPWIGRGEALAALAKVLKQDDVGAQLADHASDCARMAALVTATDILAPPPPNPALIELHEQMLQAHGANPATFWTRATEVIGSIREEIVAQHAGTLQIDIGKLRSQMVEAQNLGHPVAGAKFSDPCGLLLNRIPGSAVVSGETIALARNDIPTTPIAWDQSIRLTTEAPSVTHKESDFVLG